MRNNRRWPAKDSDLAKIPEGVNPFGHFVDQVASQFFPNFSRFTTALLVIFFIFHLLIASFCLVILVMPYFCRTNRSQWFFRRLYPRGHSGENAPLFWINAGLLMTISQFMGSVATQAFILINIKWKQSINYALHNPLDPALGVMVMCEMVTYWALLHCFVVAICYDQRTDGDVAKRVTRWTVSPTFINFMFFYFPLGVVATIVTLTTCLTMVDHKFEKEVIKGLGVLRHGASVWERLRMSTTPDEEKIRLTLLLLHVASDAKVLSNNANLRLENFVKLFHLVFCVVLTLHCLTFLVFLCVSWLVVRKFQQHIFQSAPVVSNSNPFRRWFRPKDSQTTSEGQRHRTNQGLMNIATSNRQFFHLLLRALCISIAMITATLVFGLGILKTDDVVRTPKWRGIMVWLVTVTGSWSSIPIAWQCWRLYQDESTGASQASAHSKGTSTEGIFFAPHSPWQSEPEEIEIGPEPPESTLVIMYSEQ